MRKLIVTKKSAVKKPPAPIEVTTIRDFIDRITDYARNNTKLSCYRGQRNKIWRNTPSIFRKHFAKLEANEKRAVRDLMSVHPSEFSEDKTMFDRLVRMQHFGLPTRLMDVSLNPLVALYFATDPGPKDKHSDGVVTAFAIPEGREKYFDSDSVSCIANLSNMTVGEKEKIIDLRRSRPSKISINDDRIRINEDEIYKRLHQFIRSEKAYFLPIIHPVDLFKPYYVHPKMSNRRIVAQAGAFIIHGLSPPRNIRFKYTIEETGFIIPEPRKSTLRAELDLLGINESTLFPEIDKAAERIKTRYTSAI